MELSVTRTPVLCSETLFDGQAEQGVEFDYVLPDYYPDIFKIIKCSMRPGISAYNIQGDKLSCDGAVHITVLYLTENSEKIYCVEHRYTYSKTVDLPKSADKATVTIKPKTDYCSCRAVSGRRIDVRGAVSFKIKVCCSVMPEIITEAKGLGTQTKTAAVVYGGKSLTAEKLFLVREDIEAGGGNVKAVISCDAAGSVSDCKIIADKVVVKGEAAIKALYLCEDDNRTTAHTLRADIPLSQIADIPGITEQHSSSARFEILSCELSFKHSTDEGNAVFGCEMTVGVYISAGLEQTIYPVIDMYSTDYESGFDTMLLRTEAAPVMINGSQSIKEILSCSDGEILSVIDTRCEISDTSCKTKGDELIVCGKALFGAMVTGESGKPVFLEKTSSFEAVIPVQLSLSPDCVYQPELYITVGNTAFSLADDHSVEIRATITAAGMLYRSNTAEVIKEIKIDQSAPKQRSTDYPLKLYFMQENEDIWAIAKRYNTSAAAVEEENNSENDIRKDILLIPIV